MKGHESGSLKIFVTENAGTGDVAELVAAVATVETTTDGSPETTRDPHLDTIVHAQSHLGILTRMSLPVAVADETTDATVQGLDLPGGHPPCVRIYPLPRDVVCLRVVLRTRLSVTGTGEMRDAEEAILLGHGIGHRPDTTEKPRDRGQDHHVTILAVPAHVRDHVLRQRPQKAGQLLGSGLFRRLDGD